MIRPATPSDASSIAELIVLAMGDALAGKLANSDDRAVYIALFEKFAALSGNPYSYENSLVWGNSETVSGMIIGYNGADFRSLREPFLHYTRTTLGFSGTPEDETQAGEFYIDCLAVLPQYQGKGIAKALIEATLQNAAGLEHHRVGLLVNKENEKAWGLYERLGFKLAGEKNLLGGRHYHLQYQL